MWEIKIYHLEDWIFRPYDMCPFCDDKESNFVMGKEVRKEYSFSFSHFKLNKDIDTYHTLPPSPL